MNAPVIARAGAPIDNARRAVEDFMPKGPCAARVLLILLSQLFSLKDGSDWCDAISFRREKKEKEKILA